MNESQVVASARLRAAVEALTRAEVEQAVAIAELAEAHQWTADATFDVIGTRPVRIGADGTALVDEFLPLEVATLKGISVASATWLIRDVVNLRARHPLLWFQATRGLIPMFRACMLAAEVARFDLTVEQARALDERLAPKVPTLPWRRVLQLARGLVTELAAEKVTALQQDARNARFVRKVPTDDPSTAYISARVDTADAIFFDAMVDRIADILGTNGDSDTKEVRRAKSIGILATPARAQLLLSEAVCPSSGLRTREGSGAGWRVRSTDPRLLPQAQVYVHVAEETLLRGAGPARVEGVGAFPAAMLKHLLGHSRVRLTPVVRPYAEVATDSYEIPDPIRRQVLLRDTFEVFPFSSRPPRAADLDHTVPYSPGGRRQTRASNLGPLSRKSHRAKTHAGWVLEQPAPGVFWWQTPTGERCRVGPNGTIRIGRNPRHRSFEQALWNSDHDVGGVGVGGDPEPRRPRDPQRE
jgi:5-methylcytosine-specific restriction endonuclease McrA